MAMAYVKYTCKKCGKEVEYTHHCVNRKEADRYEEWAKDRFELCSSCYAEEKKKAECEAKAKAMAKVEAWEKETGMPELYGSEKQVRWAREIRYNTRNRLRPADGTASARREKSYCIAEYMMKSCTSAAEWIDGREDCVPNGESAGHRMFMEWKAKYEETQHGVDYASDEYVRHPEERTKPGDAKITLKNDEIIVKYVKDEDFMSIVKSLGYRWSRDARAWARTINKCSGPIIDRAAELGNALLRAGFSIRAQDISVLNKAVEADFKPEQTKWVAYRIEGDYTGYLSVSVPTDELYQAARKLPGGKWSAPAIAVPLSGYREVLDFAELYGYSISDGAKKAIDFEKEKTAVVQPKKPKHTEETGEEKLAEILKQGSDIINDLKDED